MDFELTPASTGTLITLGVIAALLVGLASMFVWIAWGAGHGSITITNNAVQVRIPTYGRVIPMSKVNVERARVLSIEESKDVHFARRTNGIGLPGYTAGWFKLPNGTRALLSVTQGRVLFIPTTEGYSVWLSVADPDAALAQLKLAAR